MTSPPFILIVDDHPANRYALSELLSQSAYELAEAASGPEALRIAAATPPDLILLDVMMPEMDGFEVCRRLRADSTLAEVPVIMVTALDDQASRLAGINAGADDFITKPIQTAELRARVRTITRLNRYRRLMQAQERVREQARWLDEARDAIFVRDLEGRITYWNQGAERTFGWSSAEAVGRGTDELLKPEKPSAGQAALAAVMEAGHWQGEIRKTAKTGKVLTLASRLTLMRDRAGHPDGILEINTDITQQKETADQFFRLQRLESIGALASGVAHDLNNVLSPILMGAEMLKRPNMTGPRAMIMVDAILLSAKRGADMVRQVLAFARGTGSDRVLLQPAHLVRDMVKLARETFPKNITIQSKLDPELWTMESDATRLHQVLLNLFVNARDAMPSGGSITATAENVLLDDAAAAGHPGAAAGPHVRLRVADTGTGIPPDVMARIFDPFFTTKEAGKGTGLGLSTVLTILKEHNGFITVESVVNQGTSFSAHFPARMGAVEDGGKAESASPVGAGQTVLVVDDEGAIRGMIKGILESHGYQVETAGDAGKALELFSDHASAIHAVVTDLAMPGMASEQLIRVLRERDPRLPIIVSSGSAEPKAGLLNELAVRHVLRKPYTARALLEALDSALRW